MATNLGSSIFWLKIRSNKLRVISTINQWNIFDRSISKNPHKLFFYSLNDLFIASSAINKRNKHINNLTIKAKFVYFIALGCVHYRRFFLVCKRFQSTVLLSVVFLLIKMFIFTAILFHLYENKAEIFYLYFCFAFYFLFFIWTLIILIGCFGTFWCIP